MPIYAITDRETQETVAVEAATSAQAVRVYMGDRLVVKGSLDGPETAELLTSGARFIKDAKPKDKPGEALFSESEPVASFTAGMADSDKPVSERGGEK